MYRASTYGKSQETLLEFASKFNSIEVYPNLYCCPIIKETMLNDGCFVDVGLGKLVAFDWEIRTRLKSFKPGEFKFKTLTEFERKFSPEKNTQLFIQCDQQEQYIAVAWREDFMKSRVTRNFVEADIGKQYAERRETSQFKVFELNNLAEFKKMLNEAFQTTTYSHKIFTSESNANSV